MISALRADAFVEPRGPDCGIVVRKAAMRDITPILDLINGYAARGIMLPRTEFEMSEAIRDFSVATLENRLLGCGALHFYTPDCRNSVAGGPRRGQDQRCRPQTGGTVDWGSAGIRAGCGFRVHLRGRILPKSGVPNGGARHAAAQGLEGLPAQIG